MALLLLPGLVWLEARTRRWRKQRAQTFAAQPFADRLLPNDSRRRWQQTALYGLALAALILAWARPQGEPQAQMPQALPSLEIRVVLDLSLSMLAQDCEKNRLTAAKREIEDLVADLPQDRFSLIGFAGDAQSLCPATLDHAALASALQQAAVGDFLAPGSDPVAGLRLAMDQDRPGQGARAIVMVSDGEANRPGDLADWARQAALRGIHVYTVGVGTWEGAPIPLGPDLWGKERFRVYHGRKVITRLKAMTLREAAQFGRGRYTRSPGAASSLAADLDKLNRSLVRQSAVTRRREYYPWLVVLALLLLGVEPWWPWVRRKAAA
jgi:Ca-activated chloride channel family protein